MNPSPLMGEGAGDEGVVSVALTFGHRRSSGEGFTLNPAPSPIEGEGNLLGCAYFPTPVGPCSKYLKKSDWGVSTMVVSPCASAPS